VRAGPDGARFDAALAIEVTERHPFALVVVDADDVVVAQNAAARALLGPAADRLAAGGPGAACELLACREPDGPAGERCLHAEARALGETLPELRLPLPAGGAAAAAWVLVAPMAEGRVLMQLRAADPADRRRAEDPGWRSATTLRVRTLGRTRVESDAGELQGSWIGNRPGQVFKYLLTNRHRPVPGEELAERLSDGPGKASLQSVRYFIHALRDELEPGRRRREPSAFVAGSRAGYRLDLGRVHVDADDFERELRAGLAAVDRGDEDDALAALRRGLELYGGDFLEDEPYAEWALEERDRLRELATAGLRAKARLHRARGDVVAATDAHERLARLEPFDVDLHRELLELLLAQGRRTDAARRYVALRHRLLATFGEDVDFLLADLTVGS
jgi:DNA-binding SARP family transcriptional activator